MVHYIRFLKSPKAESERERLSVKALVTVTTDLGDDFFHTELPLHVMLLPQERTSSSGKKVLWKSGMRVLAINIQDLPLSVKSNNLTLAVSPRRSMDADELAMDCMPEVLGAQSPVVMPNTHLCIHKIERRLQTSIGCIRIFEDAGESIARHIWDAGVALTAHLDRQRNQSTEADLLPTSLAFRLKKAQGVGLRILELGSGCGLIGIWISTALPNSNVTLTDMPEAMEILGFNVNRAMPAAGSSLRCVTFDWNHELPKAIQEPCFDIICVSDCTYNCDSIPSLVKSILALVARAPEALIIVSMKVRHDSESIFFELMSKGGLLEAEHDSVKLGSRHQAQLGLPPESVDIYVYRCPDSTIQS